MREGEGILRACTMGQAGITGGPYSFPHSNSVIDACLTLFRALADRCPSHCPTLLPQVDVLERQFGATARTELSSPDALGRRPSCVSPCQTRLGQIGRLLGHRRTHL